MSEENGIRQNGYNEGDLFSSGNDPASNPDSNHPKPLFPETEIPQIKPLFGNAEEINIAPPPAGEEKTISAPPPEPAPQVTEAFIENKLKEAGPTAFVDQPGRTAVPVSQEFISKPDEGPTRYVPQPSAPEIKEPIIVQTKTPQTENESAIEVPANAPAPEKAMTAESPEDSETSFTEKKAQAEDKQKLKTARPLPSTGPRYGKVRTREAIIPADIDRNKNAITADPATTSIGKLMQNARKQAGMSLEQAAAATRIKKAYIEALEEDDFRSLPSGIFPSAYVRTLCGVYNLNDESRSIALEKIRESAALHEDVPEQLIQHLEQDVQKNVEEERRINKIFYLVTSAAALILILIIAGIVMLTVSLKKPPRTTPGTTSPAQTEVTAENRTAPVNSFNTEQLESLTPPQIPALMRQLSVPSR